MKAVSSSVTGGPIGLGMLANLAQLGLLVVVKLAARTNRTKKQVHSIRREE
jgi:hypothetical protein